MRLQERFLFICSQPRKAELKVVASIAATLKLRYWLITDSNHREEKQM